MTSEAPRPVGRGAVVPWCRGGDSYLDHYPDASSPERVAVTNDSRLARSTPVRSWLTGERNSPLVDHLDHPGVAADGALEVETPTRCHVDHPLPGPGVDDRPAAVVES